MSTPPRGRMAAAVADELREHSAYQLAMVAWLRCRCASPLGCQHAKDARLSGRAWSAAAGRLAREARA